MSQSVSVVMKPIAVRTRRFQRFRPTARSAALPMYLS